MTALPAGPPPANGALPLARYALAIGRNPIEFQRKRFDEYGDTYLSVVNDIDSIVTRDPGHIHTVLVADGESYQKPERGIGQAQLRRFLGDSLVSSNGDVWRSHRRQIQPAFDAGHLRTYADTMVAFAEEAAASWSDGDRIDMSAEMMSLTLRVVGKVLFGQDTRAGTGHVAHAMLAFREGLGGLSATLPSWLPYPPRERVEAARMRMHRLMDGWVEECRAGRSPDPQCLLNVLVQSMDAVGGMTNDDLRDEALTLFFAGHETTSNALSWTWYLLARHPAIRERVRAEALEVLGDRAATFDDFSQLTYTEQVLSEAMRLYPPVFSVAREAKRRTTLGPWDVPEGTHVILGIYHAHHDTRWHPAPETFDPDRFEAEAAKRMAPGSYLPFGSGTRTCIGKRFALLEATLILATIARRCRLSMWEQAAPEMSQAVTLAPKGGIPMRVEPLR